MAVVVAVVVAIVLVATYVTWLAGRLDRLHTRTDGALAALDAQLVRRAAAGSRLADHAERTGLLPGDVTAALLDATSRAAAAAVADREALENDVSRLLRVAHAGLPPGGARDPELAALLAAVDTAASRVVIARRFYNDAVRDTHALRRRRVVRWLRLAGRAPLPVYFEIDDTPPTVVSAAHPR